MYILYDRVQSKTRLKSDFAIIDVYTFENVAYFISGGLLWFWDWMKMTEVSNSPNYD